MLTLMLRKNSILYSVDDVEKLVTSYMGNAGLPLLMMPSGSRRSRAGSTSPRLVMYPVSGIFVPTGCVCFAILLIFFVGSSPSGLNVISSSIVRVSFCIVTLFALLRKSGFGESLT